MDESITSPHLLYTTALLDKINVFDLLLINVSYCKKNNLLGAPVYEEVEDDPGTGAAAAKAGGRRAVGVLDGPDDR